MQSEQPAVPLAATVPASAGGAANLADLVGARAAERPGAVALVESAAPRTELTWAQLDARIETVAAGLTALGLLAGHRLALLGLNSAAFVVGYLAALRAGIVAVPLNPRSTADEVASTLADSGARVLLTDHDLTPAGVRTLPLTDAGLAALAAEPVLVSSPRDVESLAVLLYTAGTSGRPKAVMLTHRALLAHVEHVGRLGFLGPDEVVLATLPLFHVFGLNAVLGSWVGTGSRLVVTDGYRDLPALIRDEGVTNLPLAPPMLHRLLDDDGLAQGLGPLRTVVAGAAPLPEDLAAAFTARTGLRVERGYGLTEAAPGVSATFGGGADAGPGHVGAPLPGVEVRIGDGRDPSEPGEIAVRGDNLFSGYWPDGRDGPDADGWFPTGDIGYVSAGELVLVDRARELVIVNGFNVYPAEVEQVIMELDEVAAVAVVGRPDVRTGEQVVAFVEGAPDAVARVEDHCAARLARFKRPTRVQLVAELPRGATGKIKKGVLRAMTSSEETR